MTAPKGRPKKQLTHPYAKHTMKSTAIEIGFIVGQRNRQRRRNAERPGSDTPPMKTLELKQDAMAGLSASGGSANPSKWKL